MTIRLSKCLQIARVAVHCRRRLRSVKESVKTVEKETEGNKKREIRKKNEEIDASWIAGCERTSRLLGEREWVYKERGTVIVQTELSALPRPPRPRLRGNDDDVRCANNIAFQRRPAFRRWEILFQKLEKRMFSPASSVASPRLASPRRYFAM